MRVGPSRPEIEKMALERLKTNIATSAFIKGGPIVVDNIVAAGGFTIDDSVCSRVLRALD